MNGCLVINRYVEFCIFSVCVVNVKVLVEVVWLLLGFGDGVFSRVIGMFRLLVLVVKCYIMLFWCGLLFCWCIYCIVGWMFRLNVFFVVVVNSLNLVCVFGV